MARHRFVALGLLTLALPAAPGAASGLPEVTVAVQSPHDVFYDGVQTASFFCAGTDCPAATASDDVDPVAQTVRKALLGFDARRLADAEPAPTSEQRPATLRVSLHEAGDLTVVLSGSPEAGADPIPIAASGGRLEGRAAVWEIASAAPGVYEFTATFAPRRDQPGPYAPRAALRLSRASGSMLRFAAGHVVAPQGVVRVSSLVLEQRVSPVTGAPRMFSSPFVPAMGSDGLADLWSVTAQMNASGAYLPGVQGARETKSVGLYADIAPGSQGLSLGANIATAWTAISNQSKATPRTGVESDGQRFTGFNYRLITEGPRLGAPLGDQLWDADSVVTSGAAAVYSPWRTRTGLPADDAGAIGVTWDGALASGWSALWARDASGATHDTGIHVVGANVHWEARGGDIDNRFGTHSRTGPPLTVELPAGHNVTGFLAVTSSWSEVKFTLGISATGNRVTLTPSVAPGGYWLRSSGSGYSRDWSINTFLLAFAQESGGAFRGETVPLISGASLVPPGMIATLTTRAPEGVRTRRIGSGAWSVAPWA